MVNNLKINYITQDYITYINLHNVIKNLGLKSSELRKILKGDEFLRSKSKVYKNQLYLREKYIYHFLMLIRIITNKETKKEHFTKLEQMNDVLYNYYNNSYGFIPEYVGSRRDIIVENIVDMEKLDYFPRKIDNKVLKLYQYDNKTYIDIEDIINILDIGLSNVKKCNDLILKDKIMKDFFIIGHRNKHLNDSVLLLQSEFLKNYLNNLTFLKFKIKIKSDKFIELKEKILKEIEK
jgi:hypothetical protein